jgi:hypothetical protein
MAAQNASQVVPLPTGCDSAEELYLDVHASVGLILADVELGFISAEDALVKIAEARAVAKEYVTALYEADQL